MALVVKDRVQETTVTVGTIALVLTGAVSGFQSFSVIGNGNTTYYAVVGGTEWEVGIGTYTALGTILSRDTILESSNGGTAVNFSVGTKNVFVTYPAEKGLYLDASGNAIALGTPVSATLTNATGLPISTGVSGLGTNVATFLATPTSANLASAVTDETGSGSLVFGTSPTIASPTFTSQATFAAGTAAAPALTTTGDTNTGIFFPAADTIAFAEGGAEAMRIDSSGNVGIGTTSPTAKLDINGDFVVTGNSGYKSISLNGVITSGNTARYAGIQKNYDSPFEFKVYAGWGSSGNGSATIFYRDAVNESMRIDSSGKVLVNTSTARTNIVGGTPQLQVEGTDGYTGSISVTRNESGNQPYLFLNSTGGTSVGSNTIVANGANLGTVSFQGMDGTNFIRGAGITAQVDGTPGTNDMPGRLLFSTTADGATSPTERMRIDSSGFVGIGTTTTSGKLNVSSSIGSGFGTNSNTVTLFSTATAGVGVGPMLSFSGNTNNSTAVYGFGGIAGLKESASVNNYAGALAFYTQNSGGSATYDERMRIHSAGGVSIGNTTDSGAASLNVSGSISGGYIAHANGTTAMAFGSDNVVRVTPTATASYTTTVPAAGAICVLSILTSGASSYTITFSTGFKSTGTLATGTTTARYFNITFVSDGTNLIEMSRTVAIT